MVGSQKIKGQGNKNKAPTYKTRKVKATKKTFSSDDDSSVLTSSSDRSEEFPDFIPTAALPNPTRSGATGGIKPISLQAPALPNPTRSVATGGIKPISLQAPVLPNPTRSIATGGIKSKSLQAPALPNPTRSGATGGIKPISLQAPALSNPTRSVAMGGVKSKSSLDPRLVPTRDKSRFSPNSPLPHSARFSPIRGDSTTVPSTYPQRVVTMEAETKKLEESSLRSSPTAELVKGDTNYLHHNAPLQPLHGSINRHPQAVGTDFTSNTASSNSNSQALNSGPPMVNPFAENIRLVF